MDGLIEEVTEKAGDRPRAAKNAVQSLIEFLKAKMPGVGEHVSTTLAGDGEGGAGDVLGSVRDKFKI